MPTIHGITYDDLARLGVDEDNRLYWDDKPLVTEERISLAWWVNVAVVTAGASTLVLAVLDALRYFGISSSG